jgi:hypothetical protein
MNLRREAETLVRATEQALQTHMAAVSQEDKGTQTEEKDDLIQPPKLPKLPDATEASTADSHDEASNQLTTWQEGADDSARWLYNLVFQNDQLVEIGSQKSAISVPTMLLRSSSERKPTVVDALLSAWTSLTPIEIKETHMNERRSPWELQLQNRMGQLALFDAQNSATASRSTTNERAPDTSALLSKCAYESGALDGLLHVLRDMQRENNLREYVRYATAVDSLTSCVQGLRGCVKYFEEPFDSPLFLQLREFSDLVVSHLASIRLVILACCKDSPQIPPHQRWIQLWLRPEAMTASMLMHLNWVASTFPELEDLMSRYVKFYRQRHLLRIDLTYLLIM